jgi:hypothetical protein
MAAVAVGDAEAVVAGDPAAGDLEPHPARAIPAASSTRAAGVA